METSFITKNDARQEIARLGLVNRNHNKPKLIFSIKHNDTLIMKLDKIYSKLTTETCSRSNTEH